MKRLSLARSWTPGTYDRIASRYDAYSRQLAPSDEDAKKRILEGLSPGSIRYVGCGTGTLLALAVATGHCPYGVETSAGMLYQARAKVPSARLTTASFYDLPFPDNFFDLVVATNALGGVEIVVPRALGEMVRV
jgi:ubiquinone/menaquinone biosynthesis C-methylase UbiE